MRPLRYSINVTLDGCADHTAFAPGADVHAHAAAGIASADAILLGRHTYALMEWWRHPDPGDELPEWTHAFREAINATTKYVASSVAPSPGWNTERLRGDVCLAVRTLKDQPGGALTTGGIHLPRTLAAAGLIDEFEFVVHPVVAGHGPWIFTGLPNSLRLRPVGETHFEDGVVARRYVAA